MNIKKLFLISLISISAFNVFAQNGVYNSGEKTPMYNGYDINSALKKQKNTFRIVAVKIIPKFENVDFEYLKEARMLGKNFANKPDVMTGVCGWNHKPYYNIGETMFCYAFLNKSTNTVRIRKSIIYFNSSMKMQLEVPLYLETPMTEDLDVKYLGTINITYSGNDFDIKSVKITDEMQEAQEELDKLITGKKPVKISHVEWKPYKPDPYER